MKKQTQTERMKMKMTKMKKETEKPPRYFTILAHDRNRHFLLCSSGRYPPFFVLVWRVMH
jgi:hypothetical protein